eukprot:141412-Lingulodinium_polyedra.AAC.1
MSLYREPATMILFFVASRSSPSVMPLVTGAESSSAMRNVYSSKRTSLRILDQPVNWVAVMVFSVHSRT